MSRNNDPPQDEWNEDEELPASEGRVPPPPRPRPQRPQRPPQPRQRLSPEDARARYRSSARQPSSQGRSGQSSGPGNQRPGYPPSPQRPQQPRQQPRPGQASQPSPQRPRVTRQFREDEPEHYPRPRETTQRGYQAQPRRGPDRTRRRVGSTLLIGCIGGIVTLAVLVGVLVFIVARVLPNVVPGFNIGTSTYTDKQQTQTLAITSSITHLDIQNPVGDVTVSVENTAPGATLTSVKTTQASSNTNASTEFGRIAISVKAGSTASCPANNCLAVVVTNPDAGIDSVNLTIVLPPQNPTPQFVLSSTTLKGKVTVQNFDGLLALTDDTGNISVQGGLLDAGSCLQSRIGSVTFSGTLQTTTPPSINPCANTPVTPGASNQPWYSMKTGTGNIDVTFDTLSTNVLLDATIANQGKLLDDFNLAVIKNPDGSANYYGPLLPNTQPTAVLTITIDVSGTIDLHKGSS